MRTPSLSSPTGSIMGAMDQKVQMHMIMLWIIIHHPMYEVAEEHP